MRTQDILHAYREIYRSSLRAIQYASPARHTLRKLINTEFRLGRAEDYDPSRVKNTVEFLETAARAKGLEHRIVKCLLHVWWFRGGLKQIKPDQKRPSREEADIRTSALSHMEITIKSLNESMGMCLPTNPSRKLDPLEYL